MRLKVASIAFLLASVATGISWLTLQPALLRLIQLESKLLPEGSPARLSILHIRKLLPLELFLDLLLITVVCLLVLLFFVVRPAERAEAAIEQLGQLNLELSPATGGGPLLSRVQAAVRQLANALRDEQRLTRKQLDDLAAANERVLLAQTELVATERLATVGKLAAGVAHEVGNPLSGVLGYLSLARDKTTDATVREYLDHIEHEVQRISTIVRGLLDLGRPAKGNPSPVVLAELVDTCVRLLQADVELRGVEIETAVDPALVIRAESGPLSQVLLNLLLNAGQAMDGRGRVRVNGAIVNGFIELAVEDDGPGLPPNVLAHLFEPFFSTKGKGTGLGLAVSQHLVQGLGGTLSATNREGGGARFSLKLPVV